MWYLFHLHLCEAFLLVNNLVLHLVFCFNFELMMANLLLILRSDDFSLFCLFSFGKVDCLLYFAFFFSSLFLDHIILSRLVAFHLLFLLKLFFFLYSGMLWMSKLTCRMRSSLRFLSETISFVRLRVSSIFFQVFISSCFNRAIRFANKFASCSILTYCYEWGDLTLCVVF